MNINRINGFSNFNIGGGSVNPNNHEPEQTAPPAHPENVDRTLVDPNEILQFMGNNTVVPPLHTSFVQLPADVVARIESSINDFENFVNVASDEFGQDIALTLADMK